MEFEILYALQSMHTPWLDRFMIAVTSLGDVGWFWIAVSFALLVWKRTRKTGMIMIGAIIIGFLVSNVTLKHLFERSRPCWQDPSVTLLIPVPSDFSFPSGHATASFAGAFAIFMNHKRWGIGALILASLITFSRLYLFVHFPSDVAVGILIGIGAAWCAGWIYKKFYNRNQRGTLWQG